MIWCPRIQYTPVFDEGAITVPFSLAQMLWSPEEGPVEGREATSAAGLVAGFFTRYDYACGVTVRFTDAEYESVMDFIEWALRNKRKSFLWRFDQNDDATEYRVYLEEPKIGARAIPKRNTDAPWTWTLDLVIRSAAATRIFAKISEGAPFVPAGAKFLITAASYDVDPSGDVIVTAQLALADNTPVLQAGHAVTWSSTNGGGFNAPVSVTNALGQASVVFTVSAIHGIRHDVTGLDQYGNTGTTTTKIEAANDGLRTVRDLLPYVLGDSIDGMVGGVNLTAFSDLSGYNTPCQIVSAPLYGATKWTGVGAAAKPGIEFSRVTSHSLTMGPLPAIAQPYTFMSIFEDYINGDTGNQNLLNAGAGISYRIAGSTNWSLFSGTPVQSNVGQPAGKRIRFDIFNGAASKVYSGATASAAIDPGAGNIGAGQMLGIGRHPGGNFDPMTCKALVGWAIFPGALAVGTMNALIALYQARFPALNGN